MRCAAVVMDREYPREAMEWVGQELGAVRQMDRFWACNGYTRSNGKNAHAFRPVASAAAVLSQMAAFLLGGWKNYDAMLWIDGAEIPHADIRKLIDWMDAEPAAGVVSPAFVRPFDLREPVSPFLVATDAPAAQLVEYVPARVALFRMAALREVGKFDEALHPHLVMIDWCYRARLKGWGSMVVPSALASAYDWWEPVQFDAMTGENDPTLRKLIQSASRNAIPLRQRRKGRR